jgi:hypothetical protein
MPKFVAVPLPLNLSEKDAFLFEPHTKYEIKPLKIKHLKKVFVTYTGLAVNRNGLIKESYHDYPEEHENCQREASYYYQLADQNPDLLIELNSESRYLLIHHPWYNYYHWIFEAILRLWIVKEDSDNMILLLPDYYKDSDFIMGSLEPFKLKNIYFIPNGKSVLLNRLCLPQLKPKCDSYHVDKVLEIRKFYLDYVRKEKGIDIDLGERIYISRRKAARKKVINEEAVELVLAKYGFLILNNEDYTFLEQVSIYSNAKYLVSIHGSGLTNMLFMKDNSSVLELIKNKTNTLNRPSFVFWYEAATLGFRYFAQVCKPVTADDDYFFGDFLIDTSELEKNLELMFD